MTELTPGQRGIIEAMRLGGGPLTRERYIAAMWNDEPPEDWDAECEDDLPEFLQGAEPDQGFSYDEALKQGD
jgi:hypothetical protein